MTSVGQDMTGEHPARDSAQQPQSISLGSPSELAALSHHSICARLLLNSLTRLWATDVITFSNELRTSFASAALPPCQDTAQRIQCESALHIEDALYSELQTIGPILSSLQQQLTPMFPDGHLILHLIKRAFESIKGLPDEQTAAPLSHKLTQYETALRNVSLLLTRSSQIQNLLDTQALLPELVVPRVERDSTLWRQATLASEIYECARRGSSRPMHVQFDIPGTHNQLLRQIPPIYEINPAELTAALGELTSDAELAAVISSNFIGIAETYQNSRILIQGSLGLSTAEMEAIEQRLPLDELLEVVNECRGLDVVTKLLCRALQESTSGLDTVDRLHTWVTELHSYCASLSPLERLAPGISPSQSPHLFMNPGYPAQMQRRLEDIRQDQSYQPSLLRLIAWSTIRDIFKTLNINCSEGVSRNFSLVMSYGFGIPSKVHHDANSRFELTTQAYHLFMEDMARIAPDLLIPSVSTAEKDLSAVLECCIDLGVAKNPHTSTGKAGHLYKLVPSVRELPNWSSLAKLVDLHRSGRLSGEYLVSLNSEMIHQKKKGEKSERGRKTTNLSTELTAKAWQELEKSISAFEKTLSELSLNSPEHVIRKQLSTLTSAVGRIRDSIHRVEPVGGLSPHHTSIARYCDLLKPPHTPHSPHIKDFIHVARTTLHLLRKSLRSSASHEEAV